MVFITFLLSAFGYEFLMFIMTVHVYSISHKALSVALFTALTFIPKVFSPYYGVFVDKHPRKIVLGINSGIVGVLILFLSLLTNIYWIYGLWFVTSFFIMFIINARTALMPEIMPADNYVWVNSMVLSTLNLAKILAPLIAGIILQYLDKNILILFTSAVYFLCMILSFLIKVTEQIKIEPKSISDNFHFIKEGMDFIRNNKGIRWLATLGVVWRLFLGMQFSLFIVLIARLGGGQMEYGLFMTIVALGSLVGSFIGPFIAKRVTEKILIHSGLAFHFFSFSLLGVLKQYTIALVIVFLSYMVFYATVVGIHSMRDKSTEVNLRGRVYGSITSVFTPPTIISMLLFGYLADIIGVGNVFVATGIIALIGLLFIIVKFNPTVKSNYEKGI